ncbi:MAG: hypothetical protein ACOY3N_09015 [Bradyrhizobium sp.]|uniref:hypothetical protein n=1 Tax=Bradyrhizobium sp. TaxID=376 RepID=UPI003BF1D5EA
MSVDELILPANTPTVVRDRVQTFLDISRERHSAVLETSAQRRTTMSALDADKALLRELEKGQRNSDQIAQVQIKIERGEKALAKLTASFEKLGTSAKAASALSNSLTAYVRAQAAFSLDHSLPQLQPGETALDGLERAARTTRKLLADRREVETAPFPSAHAKKIARQHLAARIEAVRPDAGPLIQRLDPIKFPVARLQQYGDANDVYGTDPVALLAWLLPDAMAAAIDREIDAIADDGNALTAEERREKLAQIDAVVLASEREEAAFAELAGLLPRPDIDPRAALGLAASMPAPERA